MEEYLINLPNKLKKAFTKFRFINNMLPIEAGSHHNIPRTERLRKLCMEQELGDEFHYILAYSFLAPPAERQRSFSNADSSVVSRRRRRRPSSTFQLKA